MTTATVIKFFQEGEFRIALGKSGKCCRLSASDFDDTASASYLPRGGNASRHQVLPAEPDHSDLDQHVEAGKRAFECCDSRF